VRSALEAATLGDFSAWLFGASARAEISLHRSTRLDLGAAWLFGQAPGRSKLEWFELSFGPSQRLPLGAALDLDLGAEAALALAHFGNARAVDDLPSERETWSARTAALVRLEPRLTRRLRLNLSGSFGLVLRRMPYQLIAADRQLLGELWLGLTAGVVLTPD